MHYAKMLLEALLDPLALLSVKWSKHSNKAGIINLNTLIEQSESFQVNFFYNHLKIVSFNEARIACEDS